MDISISFDHDILPQNSLTKQCFLFFADIIFKRQIFLVSPFDMSKVLSPLYPLLNLWILFYPFLIAFWTKKYSKQLKRKSLGVSCHHHTCFACQVGSPPYPPKHAFCPINIRVCKATSLCSNSNSAVGSREVRRYQVNMDAREKHCLVASCFSSTKLLIASLDSALNTGFHISDCTSTPDSTSKNVPDSRI